MIQRFGAILRPRAPETMLVSGFAGAILLTALALLLPWSHRGSLGPLDALFTATSAVCVTGLAVVDTGSRFTALGQGVILAAIQVGGLGVMTFAALAFNLVGRRMSLRARTSLADSLVHRDLGGELRSQFLSILRVVLLLEAGGAILLFAGLVPAMGWPHAAWSGLFHAVSAFCNAGFSLYADSLTGLRANPVVSATVMALIVTGGLGVPVLWDLKKRLRRIASRAPGDRFALHTRLVLWTSALLIAGGALSLLGLGPTGESSGAGVSLSAALFQSVTARTAGFNTVPIGALPLASLLVLVLLMFVGGSPGSCAGGIKTTTLALWGASLASRLRGRRHVRILDRFVPEDRIRHASAVIGLSVLWNIGGVLILSVSEGGAGTPLREIVFEQVSAFATVGLTTGLTPDLSASGRLWIVASMFVGRLGPLTMVMVMVRKRPAEVRFPEGKVMIG